MGVKVLWEGRKETVAKLVIDHSQIPKRRKKHEQRANDLIEINILHYTW